MHLKLLIWDLMFPNRTASEIVGGLEAWECTGSIVKFKQTPFDRLSYWTGISQLRIQTVRAMCSCTPYLKAIILQVRTTGRCPINMAPSLTPRPAHINHSGSPTQHLPL